MKKVLFLGGGRRVELARRFIRRGYEVHSYELDLNVPIDCAAHIIKGFGFETADYLLHLESLQKKEKFDFIFPLMEAAIYYSYLENGRDVLIVPDGMGIHKAFNKEYLSNHFYNTPAQSYYPFPEVGNPAILKPIYGFGSRGIEKVTEFNPNSLPLHYIAQKLISGKEYSVDCYFNKENKLIDMVARERIRVGSGEVITSKTMFHEELFHAVRVIHKYVFPELRGPTNIQFIEDSDKNVHFIEINARFGGGFTLSMGAGLDVIALLEKDYKGRQFDYIPFNWIQGVTLERSYRDHFFKGV